MLRVCVGCGDDVHGFVYHFFDDDGGGLDLHPCCANLLESGLLDERVFELLQETWRSHHMADLEDKRGREVRRPAVARHRLCCWEGRRTEEIVRRSRRASSSIVASLRTAGRRHRARATRPMLQALDESAEPPLHVTDRANQSQPGVVGRGPSHMDTWTDISWASSWAGPCWCLISFNILDRFDCIYLLLGERFYISTQETFA
jgi:hypothetical protein